MTDAAQPVDFDRRPPMPLSEYEQTVARVNVGYDLIMTLVHGFLRGRSRPDLHLLVVGAGGGAEIERFLPANPGWRITGVDPSEDMLALARAKADRLGVAERVTLVRGTVEDVAAGPDFDAAACLFVLHFLPDEAKLALMRAAAARLRPGAPFLVASATRPVADDALRAEFIGAWQQYGELAGMPAERMAGIIQELMARQAGGTAAQDYVALVARSRVPARRQRGECPLGRHQRLDRALKAVWVWRVGPAVSFVLRFLATFAVAGSAGVSRACSGADAARGRSSSPPNTEVTR
jgi:tRNA (cmo5U34)-methyltransferase